MHVFSGDEGKEKFSDKFSDSCSTDSDSDYKVFFSKNSLIPSWKYKLEN
jgi:hypothetical protein